MFPTAGLDCTETMRLWLAYPATHRASHAPKFQINVQVVLNQTFYLEIGTCFYFVKSS